ncbi:tumor necrosis factor receptor superfamily member 5-like isoform X2 [Erpetoichthys calabaricus]|uniref:tumor necrosis factor receptor superfamily member 5-like isoform X2 n=1 Tax=Erpetoichthys calabaricus TaxID=27687 RepID=UPI00109FDA68|nr:tumor necrosis factor receptor superfamily member 5-like isoform X2 [Erpetoichthys calabaricus]
MDVRVLFTLLLMLFSAVPQMATKSSAQVCDPGLIFSEEEKMCCEMCSPGTRLISGCRRDVTCHPCGNSEYQKEYNREKSCVQRNYCDGNVGFKTVFSGSATENSKCECMEGLHCEQASCELCRKHTECPVGYGVKENGTSKTDTVCEPCPKGYFSNVLSSTEPCLKWTECSNVQVNGNASSDNICGGNNAAIIAVICILCLLIVSVVVLYHFKGRIASICKQNKPHQPRLIPVTEPEPKTPMEETFSEEGQIVMQETGKEHHMPEEDSHCV